MARHRDGHYKFIANLGTGKFSLINVIQVEQAFSQKGIQVSCGRPILGENDEKCTKALTNLWGDMPPGRPLFKFWLKA